MKKHSKEKRKPRLKPKQKRSRVTVDSILEATAQILERFKLSESTTDKIAKLAGVSIGSLYQYFPNKESLVSALIEREIKEDMKLLEEVFRNHLNSTPQIVIGEISKWFIERYYNRRVFLRNLFIHVPEFGQMSLLMQTRLEFANFLGDFFEKRQEVLRINDPQRAAFTMVYSLMASYKSVSS